MVEASTFYSTKGHHTVSRNTMRHARLDVVPPAQVRRLMEEDNRKRRRGAKKDYQDAVRDLAAFVRKRDPRVAAWRAAEEARRAEKAAADEQRWGADARQPVLDDADVACSMRRPMHAQFWSVDPSESL